MTDTKGLYARIEELMRERDEARARVAAAYEDAADACGKPNGPWRSSPAECREVILTRAK